MPLPTMDQVEAKGKEIEYYKSYTLTNPEIDYVITDKSNKSLTWLF